MNVAIGCDHAGVSLKNAIIAYLKEENIAYQDFGTMTTDSVDYPKIALATAKAVASGAFDHGILICGTGVGMSMAANKVKGIRCALLSDTFSAKMTKEHNDANMMAIGARVVGEDLAKEIVKAFLTTKCPHVERHDRRVAMLKEIENAE